jgi:hypothetical protein
MFRSSGAQPLRVEQTTQDGFQLRRQRRALQGERHRRLDEAELLARVVALALEFEAVSGIWRASVCSPSVSTWAARA